MPIGETPYFEKKRTEKGIIHHGPVGKVGAKVVIVDDMIDTGGTLVSACEKLRAAGVQEIYILVTHGLFTESSWLQLWSLGVKRILCTDTVPLRSDIDAAYITLLPVAPLIAERLSWLTTKRTNSCWREMIADTFSLSISGSLVKEVGKS